MKLLKKDVVERVADRAGLSRKDAEAALDGLEMVVLEAVAAGQEIVLPGIGKLRVRGRPQRAARNIRTGEPVMVPAHKAVVLRPSAALQRAANA